MVETHADVKAGSVVREMDEPSSEILASNYQTARVAYLAPTLVRGDYWQPIFREMSRKLPNTVFFTSDWPGFLPGFEGQFQVQAFSGYKYLTLNKTSTGAEIGILWAPPSILWKLKRFRPDVIFTSAFSVWTMYALLYKAITGCRVVIGWEGNAPTTTYLDRPFRLKVRRTMARFADAGYTNTREGLEYLRDVIRMPEAKLVQHPHQVPDLSALRLRNDSEFLQVGRRPVFLFVASIIKRKGWRYLIEAARRLKESGTTSFSVILVGPGQELPQLQAMVSGNDLADIVQVVGPVPYESLGKYFRACDVFVLPTLEDTWGMVVLEAMVFGKAILCSKYAGSREMIQHGVNGFVFDPLSAEELSELMLAFIRDPALAEEFGRESKRRIAPYTPERSATMYASLVETVMKSSRSLAEIGTGNDQAVARVEAHGENSHSSTNFSGAPKKLRIVTTSWDDGHPADLRLAELLRSKGIQATFYVPLAHSGVKRMTDSELRALSAEGFEIGAHGYSHKLLWHLSSTDLAAEIQPCKPMLQDVIGQEVRMFCYPQGRYDANAIRAVRQAGFNGARTVRMLATAFAFDPFQMPTTVQVYPHPQSNYVKNLLRGRKLDSLETFLAHRDKLSNWFDLGQSLFDSVMENGGIWHLYGHSWELDDLGLWGELERLLDYVGNHDEVMYLANGDALQLASLTDRAAPKGERA